MLFDIFIIFGGINLSILGYVLGSLGSFVPDVVPDVLSYLFFPLRYLSGIFPVTTLFSVISALCVFYGLVFTIKIIKFIVDYVPGLRK